MSFTDEQIARVAHGAAVELAIVLGDPAIPAWNNVPTDQRAKDTTVVKYARHGASPEVVHEKRMQLDADLPPFDQLEPGQHAYAYLFTGICAAMNEASDIKTRAENEQAALAEAAHLVASESSRNQPFSGATPVAIPLKPQPPARAQEE